MRIISSGEVLWDIFQSSEGSARELLGGAPLNFSASLQRLGHSVWIITGVGQDVRGERAVSRIAELGLSTEFIQSTSRAATGIATVTVDSSGHATFVIPRPAAFDCLNVDDNLFAGLQDLNAEWFYFGTLAQTESSNLSMLLKIFRDMPALQGFYDINLREGHWTLRLVQQLSALASVIKMNDAEAETLSALEFPEIPFSLESFCRLWCSRYKADILCVTLGSKGCAIFAEGILRTVPGYNIVVADTVGAGDAFAAGFLHALSQAWTLDHKAAFANALGALVASREGATPGWKIAECEQIIAAGASTP